MRWVGPETLVDMVLEGCKALALADSGSQVNTMTQDDTGRGHANTEGTYDGTRVTGQIVGEIEPR